jgi:signal transduction histidine kinase
MPGMNSGVNVNNPVVVAAFRAAFAHQGLIVPRSVLTRIHRRRQAGERPQPGVVSGADMGSGGRMRVYGPPCRWGGTVPTQRLLRWLPLSLPTSAVGARRARLRAAASVRRRVFQWPRLSWVDIAWVGFVGLNLAAMRLLPAWQTIPFLAIWVSLTVIYGFRLWRLQPTILTLAAVTVATGGIIGVQVLKGQQDTDYLAEVPLIALMFLVMVWHGRRRLAATEDRLAAMEEVQRVSQENLRLLKQQRRFLQDASHELGTPITVALGHAELIERAVTDTAVAEDAHVVTDELMRLRRLATRMLLLASAGSPDFLHLEPVAVESVTVDALDRWGHTPRRWRLTAAEATVLVDRDRLALALDALLENAIAHTAADDLIELGARRENGHAVLSVADSGCGIPAADLERIFLRFARADPHQTREAGGFGLGLAIVQAIAEAHHGSARARSTPGHGSVFEILLPLMATTASLEPPASPGLVTARPSSPDAGSSARRPVLDSATGQRADRPV